MSLGKTLKKVVGAVAPTIGAALGGPFGGVAMKFLADKFVGGDTGKVEDFLVNANPEALKELKLADMDFKKRMKELDIRLEELDVEDRSSARTLAKERGIVVQAALSVFYTLGYFGIMATFIFGLAKINVQYSDMVIALIGALGTVQIQIMNFWFGSSRGSKDKTDALHTAIKNGHGG
jgi:hypothetical protein